MRDELKLAYDSDGNPIEIIGCWMDVTDSKQAEQAIKERERESGIITDNLEEANIVLKVLLKRRDEYKIGLEEKILLNTKQLDVPFLEKLKMSGLDEKQNTYGNILELNLNDIISPFSQRLFAKFLNFIPSEIQVANLLRQGKTSKEIAELIHFSPRTVATYRENIRKKLGLNNKIINLKSYLSSLT